MTLRTKAVILGLACLAASHVAVARAEPATGEKIKTDVKQAVADVKTYAGETKAAFEKRTREALDDLDAKIDALNAKMSDLGAEAKKKAKAQLKQLKKKRRIAGRRFDEVKSASEKGWESLKSAADQAVTDLRATYEGFKADLK